MTETASTDTDAPAGSKRKRWIALGLLLVLMVAAALLYWQYRKYYPSTENAYVGSEIVRVASEVNGVVERVYVDTDATVKAGDPLFDLDPTLYDTALRGAQAQFDAAASASGTEGDNLKDAAKALNDQRRALETALSAYRQSKSGQAADAGAEKAWQDALTAYSAAEAKFVEAQDADITITTPTAKLRAAAAQLQKAIHDRVKTHVLAPSAGTVAAVDIRPGATIQAGRPVFALIEGGRWWVDANFKETDIGRIRAGQPADIVLDMYPGTIFTGTVESISPGSGATFSVLPAENASGNWVKVTQRFAVRVGITDPEQQTEQPLRVGATATVTVDTTGDEANKDAAAAEPSSDSSGADQAAQ